MSRRRRPRRAVNPAAAESLVPKNDGNWWVRPISGASSTKTYRCPGCQQSIAPATPHVVVWPEVKALLSAEAVDERRHWHNSCWARKK